jgi:hypothetical protein
MVGVGVVLCIFVAIRFAGRTKQATVVQQTVIVTNQPAQHQLPVASPIGPSAVPPPVPPIVIERRVQQLAAEEAEQQERLQMEQEEKAEQQRMLATTAAMQSPSHVPAGEPGVRRRRFSATRASLPEGNSRVPAVSAVPSDVDGDSTRSSARLTSATSSLEAELSQLSLKELRKKAAEAGCDDDAIENARDMDDPKAALIALIVAATPVASQASVGPTAAEQEAELQACKVPELRKKAAEAGCDDDAIEDARDMDDPKAALIALIVAATPVASQASVGPTAAEQETALQACKVQAAAPDPTILRARLQAQLATFGSKQLRELAAGEGIAPSAIEDARDADDPKAALSALLLALDDPADLIGRLLLAMP